MRPIQPLGLFFLFVIALPAPALPAEPGNRQISLAGAWDFRLDPQDQGIREKWFDAALPEKIKLPGSTDENGFGTKRTKRVAHWLNRVWEYVGPAWYQKEVTIPDGWKGKRLVLFLERCHWETQVWVDGKPAGMQDSLCTPHEYDLTGLLAPGKHRLAIRVDNRIKINVGPDAHSISDHTQTNWNGIIGRMELRATDPIWIEDMQVYPDVKNKTARVVTTIRNLTGRAAGGSLSVLPSNTGDVIDVDGPLGLLRTEKTLVGPGKEAKVELTISLGKEATAWDEFHPEQYGVLVNLNARDESKTYHDRRQATFGLREFRTEGTQFTINGRKTFLRGTLECCIFPLTGYPPMDVEGWRRIIRVAKSHGLNHFRFHSWCPPEAGFEAADREGFYFHVETPVWTTLGGDPKVDAFIHAEADRILKYYGNHPSFCMLCVGNEPSGNKQGEFLSKIVKSWKERDPRRLYTGASAWPVTPESDYHSRYAPRIQLWGAGLKSRVNAGPLSTDVDYRDEVARFKVPVVSHEVGQWCVYPNFDEIKKYTGVVRAGNFEIVRESLQMHHMLDQAHDFLIASGKLQALLYKEEIEAALRTPDFGGFQLLDLHDFPGQGTALVGVVDAFWDSKGYITPKEFHEFCCETVPLLRMKKCVWTTDETFSAAAEVAHYGPAAIERAVPTWTIADSQGRPVAAGELPGRAIPLGGGTPLGKIELPLAKIAAPTKLVVSVSLKGTSWTNHWDIWIYPAKVPTASPADVLVATALDQPTLDALAAGRKVLLLPSPDKVRSNVPPGFSSIFWNTAWTRRQPPHTLGILCNPMHPALAGFPTEFHSNWQWWDLISKSRAMVLDDFPADFRPLVQVIDDWNTNRKLGLVFEAKVGGGKLLVASMDLQSNLENRPVARQMRRSLLDYMDSSTFTPGKEIKVELVRRLLK